MAGLNHQAHGELDLSIGSALPRARRLGSIASFRPCANHFQVDPDNQTISEQARTSHSGQLATSPGWLNEHSVLRRETTATHPWISSLASRLILVVDGCLDPRKDGAVACRGEASALGIDCRAVTGAGLSLRPPSK